MKCCAAAAALFAVIGAPAVASASGILVAGYGGDQASPAMPNTYAVYFNPAALGGTTGSTVTADATLVFRWAKYARGSDALSPSDPSLLNDPSYVSANTGQGNLFNVGALPFLGIDTDFGTKNLHAGYAFYIPFGGTSSWTKRQGEPDVPGSTDGPQRWADISSELLAIYNTFALAYRIEPAKLSVGASVSPIIHTVSTIRAANADGSDDTLTNGKLAEGRTLLGASGFQLGAAFGLYWEPADGVKIGLSYTSQPGFSDTRMRGTLKQQLATTAANQKSVDFYTAYPDIVRLGGVVRVAKPLDVFADVAYVRWSVLKNQCVVPRDFAGKCNVDANGHDLSGGQVILNVPRNWHDSIEAKAGPTYWVNDRLKLHGSFGVSTPAAPTDTIDAASIDALRFGLSLGVGYQIVPDKLAVDFSYSELHYLNVTTTAQSPADRLQLDAVSRTPSGNGTYKSEVGLVDLNLAYHF